MISDPASSSSIVAGVAWVQDMLLGTAATSIAIICVAGVGYQFLTGRVPARRAMTVILGCFILFGAPGIAAALGALASREAVTDTTEQVPPPPPQVVPISRPPSRAAPDPFNPYPDQ